MRLAVIGWFAVAVINTGQLSAYTYKQHKRLLNLIHTSTTIIVAERHKTPQFSNALKNMYAHTHTHTHTKMDRRTSAYISSTKTIDSITTNKQ